MHFTGERCFRRVVGVVEVSGVGLVPRMKLLARFVAG